jgi:hypothetical protein
MLNQFLGIRSTRARSSLTKQAEEKRLHHSRLQSYKPDAEDPDAHIQDFDEWSQDPRVPPVVHIVNEVEPAPGSCTLGPASLLIDAQNDSAPQDCLGFRPSRRHASVRSSKSSYQKSISTRRTSGTFTFEGSSSNKGVLSSLGCVLGSPSKSYAAKRGSEKKAYITEPMEYSVDDSSLENKLYWDKRASEAKPY